MQVMHQDPDSSITNLQHKLLQGDMQLHPKVLLGKATCAVSPESGVLLVCTGGHCIIDFRRCYAFCMQQQGPAASPIQWHPTLPHPPSPTTSNRNKGAAKRSLLPNENAHDRIRNTKAG